MPLSRWSSWTNLIFPVLQCHGLQSHLLCLLWVLDTHPGEHQRTPPPGLCRELLCFIPASSRRCLEPGGPEQGSSLYSFSLSQCSVPCFATAHPVAMQPERMKDACPQCAWSQINQGSLPSAFGKTKSGRGDDEAHTCVINITTPSLVCNK